MWIFYFLLWTAVRASAEEPLYRKIGDQAVLTPDSVENPITNIRWKHGPNIAMEWYGDQTISYRQFKDRGSLNISTGVMTITGLTPDLSGIYTVEINTKVNSETQLLVISPVLKPNLTVSCERTYCVFTCSGSITDTEPVTYWWTAGEKRWNSTKELRITKEEKEEWFICTLENPVSSISSEKVFNPFIEIISDKTSRLTSPAIGVPVAVCIIIIIIIIFLYLRYKYRKAAADLQSFKPQWQYKGDKSGDWCDFIEKSECSVTSDDIEEQYQKNPNGKMLLAGEEYELDFKEMTKTNLRTNAKRKIRCVLLPAASPPAEEEISSHITTSAAPPETSNEAETALMLPAVPEPTSGVTCSNSNTAVVISRAVRFTSNQNQTSVTTHSNSNTAGFKPQWEFERRSGGGWHDFRKKRDLLNECSVTNDDIQKHYQDTPHVKMPLTVNEEICELDFNKMILTNLEDKTESNIRFVLVIPPSFLKAFSAAFPLKALSARDTVDGTEQEREEMSPAVQESSNQDSTVTYSNSNRAVISTVPEVHKTPAQDLEAAEALNPSNDTEKLASLPAEEESSIHITTSAAPETSNETEW